MARPIKDGIDYFPLDVDFLQDDKIRLIKAEFGPKGIVIIIALFCDIYRTNGYFKVWDNDACLLMADAVGCGIVPEYITQVVQGCLRRSIFDDGVFQMFGILTSAGIQRRYIRAVSTRDQIYIYREYWLLNEDDKKDVPVSVLNKIVFKNVSLQRNEVNLQKNSDEKQINPQSKVKESKVKKRKENNKCGAAEAATPHRSNAVITIPLNDRTEYEVTDANVKEWAELYPAVNIMQELRKMKGWCEGNPNKRKTRKGVLRFIHAWLSKAQDQGGSRYGGQRLDHTSVARGGTQTPTQPAASGKYGEYL